MACTRLAPLLLLAASACAASPPALRQTGLLAPGAVISASGRGNISLYAPERGQPEAQFTLEAYGLQAAQGVTVHRAPRELTVDAKVPGVDLLLRGPKGSIIQLRTSYGNINVADFDGIVIASTGNGDIKMLLPQYGQAHAGTGNVSVIFASTTWRGTLHFSSQRGDVELYVNENAAARVHLDAAHGTIFTDFPLKGAAHGLSEQIDGTLNGGPGKSARAIDVFAGNGSIRLLQLKPQV